MHVYKKTEIKWSFQKFYFCPRKKRCVVAIRNVMNSSNLRVPYCFLNSSIYVRVCIFLIEFSCLFVCLFVCLFLLERLEIESNVFCVQLQIWKIGARGYDNWATFIVYFPLTCMYSFRVHFPLFINFRLFPWLVCLSLLFMFIIFRQFTLLI